MKSGTPIAWGNDDHIEHWDHPTPSPGNTCLAGTEHLHTYGPNYTLGGLLGLSDALRLCRIRLAESLGVDTEAIAYVHTGWRSGASDGFSYTLPTQYGPAMITYGRNRLWTYCPTAHPVRSWWFMDCKCAVELPRAPAGLVIQAAVDLVRRHNRDAAPTAA
jgi:hypothetical protein